MNKTWAVFKYQLINTISRRSFILTLILVPLIPALIVGLLGLLNTEQTASLTSVFSQEATSVPVGIVDKSGLIRSYPKWLTEDSLPKVLSEEIAREDIAKGSLSGYYVIEEDYLSSGKIRLVKPEVNPLADLAGSGMIEDLIDYNLLNADPDLYLRYTNPTSFVVEPIKPSTGEARDSDSMLGFFLPYGITILFYVLILASSSMMLDAIGKEKDNRVMEMLISSMKPIQMFTGKIIALGLAGLLQMIVWFGAAVLILRLGGGTLNIPANLQIPISVFLWGIPFFLLGYGLYGILMAGVGAMAPNLREGSQSTFILTLPLILTLVSIGTLIQSPDGGWATFLSFFPLTAPVAMMTRLSSGAVPLWQIGVSLLLLGFTVWFLLRGISNVFRAQTLLTGSKFSVGSFFKALVRG